MKIALVLEDSQANKNAIIYEELKKTAEKYGHEVINVGMFSEEDKRQLNFTQVGFVASILIESQAADFIVTGCGTGQGAMISCNAFPNLVCGYVAEPLDAFLFSQVNAGNVISMAYAQNFGWGAEKNLQYIFETLLRQPFGEGYPAIHAEGEKRSRVRMQEMKQTCAKSMTEIIHSFSEEYIQSACNEPRLLEVLKNQTESELAQYVVKVCEENVPC